MVNFIMIAVCIIAGMIFRATNSIHPEAHKGINTWILYIALPAVSLKYIPKVQWSKDMLLPAATSIIVLIGGWAFTSLYCRYKHYSRRSQSTLELATSYSNTSFLGFPLITAYFGADKISIAIICDQMMFILLSTFGIICAVKGGGRKGDVITPQLIAKRLFTFPPFIGCASALILSQFLDLSVAEPFFDKLVSTVGPLALFSVGLQLKFKGWKEELSQISMTMLYKLLLAPLLVALIALAFHVKGDIAKISVFEAAMPTLITSSIIAEQYHLNTRLVNLIIGISIIVGFATTAIWWKVVDLIF